MGARRGRVGVIVALVVLGTACGGGQPSAVRSSRAVRALPTVPSTTTVTEAPTDAPTPAPTATPTSPPNTTPTPTPEATAAPYRYSIVDHLVGIGNAHQVVSVIADDYGEPNATLTAYERGDDGWHTVFGPWTANLGSNGFAPPDEKREGDGRTPTGSYGFDFFFGVLPNPGVRFPYRDVTSTAIVWDDDPASARYNEWVDASTDDAGADPEPMYNVPAYNVGAVIAYNASRTPGLGSAIFLHVSKGGPTAGCVALPQPQLVDLLRWLDPAQQPRIVMGTRAAVTS